MGPPLDDAAAQMALFDRLPTPAISQDGLANHHDKPERPTRRIKVEADGDRWAKKIRPKIRLMGKWLERAGFAAGTHVEVKPIADGLIELRSQKVTVPERDSTPLGALSRSLASNGIGPPPSQLPTNSDTVPIAKFRIGRIVTTPHALETLSEDDIHQGIARHQAGDWGDVTEAHRRVNESALIEGARLWSVYCSAKGLKFWIITEADRSSTCVLMPEDY
jgi:hypothetical protein